MAYRHLKKFKIDPILYMTEWFMCIFSRTLPWACVLRVWDMFFCEGIAHAHTSHLTPLTALFSSLNSAQCVFEFTSFCGCRSENRVSCRPGAPQTNARLGG